MTKNKKYKISSNIAKKKFCNSCNPQKHLKFNFTFTKELGTPCKEDSYKLLERLQFLSSEMYKVMLYKYQGDKKIFIEDIPIEKMRWNKTIPEAFRELHPTETNEKYNIFRIYPAGTPKDTANPRIIGMIKNTIFYIFYIDWKGTSYDHGR